MYVPAFVNKGKPIHDVYVHPVLYFSFMIWPPSHPGGKRKANTGRRLAAIERYYVWHKK